MNKKFLSAILFGALLASSAGTFTSCKDYDDDIKGLQEQIDANKKTLDDKLAALQTAMDAAKLDIAAAKAAAAAAQTAADKAAEAAAAAKVAATQAKVDAIAEAQRLVNELKVLVDKKVDQTAFNTKMQQIDATINVINGKLDTLADADKGLQLQIDALKNFQTAIQTLNLATEFPALKTQVATLVADLTALQTQVGTNTTDLATVKSQMTTLSNRVDSIETGLNTLISLLSHRLTALTFAPSEFVNGIEVINFATLSYIPWIDLTADDMPGATTVSINNGKTTATYYASPSSITKTDITNILVKTQDATNTTRATVAPITVSDYKVESGKLTVYLKKNTTESLEKPTVGNVEHFTLLALEAGIKLTQKEINDGVAPTVFSDWARLTETTVRPYIHKAEVEGETGTDTHFYTYTQIHSNGDVKVLPDAVCDTGSEYIVKTLPYNAPAFDLKSLVKVCDNNGHFYDETAYGLKFEFALVDYYLQAVGEEKTNQLKFAKIDANDKITSNSFNGTPNNRDAIGREPMIRVVLRDVANNNVVDVRYFKIAWTAERINTNLGNLTNFAKDFVCGGVYDNTVGTEAMNNKVYTVAVANGISKEEFHSLYTLDTQVYASLDNAVAGTPASAVLGTITAITAPGSTTTHNLVWAFNIADMNITLAEYEAGTAVRTVYGRYVRNGNSAETYTFNISLTLTIAKMAFIAGYNQPYWNSGSTLSNTNADKTFQVNPALTSDATYGITTYFDCQIVANMLKGYNKTEAINAPIDLVSNATSAKLVFDENRISALGTGWSVSVDGSTLFKNTVIAATITSAGVIQLHENPYPTATAHGIPTQSAQLLLGKNVPVKLVATYCTGFNVILDRYQVNIINPLAITLANVTDSFQDLLTGGSTISVDKIATIKETFGQKRTVWTNGVEFNPADKLVQWYDVKGVTWDLTKAKTNLKKEGNNIIISTEVNNDWSAVYATYQLTASPSNTGALSLTFKNNSGAHLQQAFKIAVPVYVQTKWVPELTDPTKQVVVLTVNPGITN